MLTLCKMRKKRQKYFLPELPQKYCNFQNVVQWLFFACNLSTHLMHSILNFSWIPCHEVYLLLAQKIVVHWDILYFSTNYSLQTYSVCLWRWCGWSLEWYIAANWKVNKKGLGNFAARNSTYFLKEKVLSLGKWKLWQPWWRGASSLPSWRCSHCAHVAVLGLHWRDGYCC